MDIIDKYNQERETTIQYDLFELLHTDFNYSLKHQLKNFGNDTVTNFVALFPIKGKTRISEIKVLLRNLKDILPKDLFEAAKEEVRDICDDYKWINSNEGKNILQIEEWIKAARHSMSVDFPSELIYIGRSYVNPISLIVGGYVKGKGAKDLVKSYFDQMNPPIAIEYKITVYETER